MPLNYDYSFTKGGKIIFVQNEVGEWHGARVLRYVQNHVKFPDYYYHYQCGGHVAALHRHLDGNFFFRIDFKNFFYSISRNRVAAALSRSGYRRARTSAKWSCVKNPIANGIAYSLPIGFVQSSALATMALMGTNIASSLDAAASRNVYVSVYLDDLIGSGNDMEEVQSVYEDILSACATANLRISDRKLIAPCKELEAFNCHLKNQYTAVTQERIDKFHSVERSEFSEAAFEAYCCGVSSQNS